MQLMIIPPVEDVPLASNDETSVIRFARQAIHGAYSAVHFRVIEKLCRQSFPPNLLPPKKVTIKSKHTLSYTHTNDKWETIAADYTPSY